MTERSFRLRTAGSYADLLSECAPAGRTCRAMKRKRRSTEPAERSRSGDEGSERHTDCEEAYGESAYAAVSSRGVESKRGSTHDEDRSEARQDLNVPPPELLEATSGRLAGEARLVAGRLTPLVLGRCAQECVVELGEPSSDDMAAVHVRVHVAHSRGDVRVNEVIAVGGIDVRVRRSDLVDTEEESPPDDHQRRRRVGVGPEEKLSSDDGVPGCAGRRSRRSSPPEEGAAERREVGP